MTEFKDTFANTAFINELTRNGINFNRVEQQIYYRLSDSKKVNEIADKVLKKHSPKVLVATKFHKKVLDGFGASNIEYREIHTDNGIALTWPDNQNDQAKKIVWTIINESL